jgi:helix-turn-helix protein
MSQQFLNKYEKEKRVIELHLAGKTIRELASELRISFTSISKIIKAYERKAKREESNQSTQPKKPPISTQAFKLFKDGKKLTDVAIDLQLPARKALKLWSQFLRLERMYECYEFYQLFQSHIPQLLAISTFIKMNKVNISNIPNILRTATDVNTLNETYYQLKIEVRSLEDKKINLSYYSPSPYSLQPLPLNKPNYRY